MTAKVSDDLIMVSARMAGQNPVLWEQFVTALEAHYWRLADATVLVPPEQVQIMQGGARQARLLCDTFKPCRETALKLQKG